MNHRQQLYQRHTRSRSRSRTRYSAQQLSQATATCQTYDHDACHQDTWSHSPGGAHHIYTNSAYIFHHLNQCSLPNKVMSIQSYLPGGAHHNCVAYGAGSIGILGRPR